MHVSLKRLKQWSSDPLTILIDTMQSGRLSSNLPQLTRLKNLYQAMFSQVHSNGCFQLKDMQVPNTKLLRNVLSQASFKS